jgi:N-acetylneuraminate synthase
MNDAPPLLVAELSGNHGGSLQKALDLVERAVDCGADAIKLQTYTPETITVAGRCDRFLLKDGLWSGQYLDQLYADAMTPWEWNEPLARKASDLGVFLFSSPFDESSVNFLEKAISPQLYKVASFEMNHFPMLEEIGKTQKPVLASTGVSTFEEIQKAISVLRDHGCPQVILLHCVSEYPAKAEDFALRRMNLLRDHFDLPVGLSDHSLGHIVAVAATAMGARVIEKHFTLDRDPNSSDGAFSMLPEEFKEMAEAVRMTFKAMGSAKEGDRRISSNAAHFKRSILVSREISKGSQLTPENIRVARPGDGLCPSQWKAVLGKTVNKELKVGHPLGFKDLES